MGKNDRAQVDPVTGEVLETPELRETSLRDLRQLMKVELDAGRVPRFVRDDDQFLLAFLRNRKHDPAAALTVITSFSKLWYSHPDIVEGLCAHRVRHFQSLHLTQFLDGRDAQGNAVVALYMGAMAPGIFTPKEQVEFSLYTLAALFDDEAMQLHGVTYVETLAGFSMWTAMKVGRSMGDKEQQDLMRLPTDTFPLRIRGIYVVEQPWYFTMFWGIVRPFLPSKMASRLRLFGHNYAALHKLVPREVLPPAFGGTATTGFDDFLDRMEAKEKECGMIGGFAIPFSVEDPTGAKRRAAAAAAAAASAAPEATAGDAGNVFAPSTQVELA